METVEPADRLAQASRLLGGTLARRTAKSERLIKRPVADYLRRAHTFIQQETYGTYSKGAGDAPNSRHEGTA